MTAASCWLCKLSPPFFHTCAICGTTDPPIPSLSTVPLVDQGAASAIQPGGLLSSATSSVQPFSHWSSPHPHRPQR